MSNQVSETKEQYSSHIPALKTLMVCSWVLGITVAQFINGKKHSPTIQLLVWASPRNNHFLITEEMEVEEVNTNNASTQLPDLKKLTGKRRIKAGS